MRPPRLAAFTVVELLVVIAIIGVLIGLLLPAVQKVRMAAARSQSENNLRQIALAVNNYQNANGQLPDYNTWLNNISSTRGCASVLVKLLPYIEQDNLYQVALQKQLSGLNVPVKTYVSPADGSSTIGTASFTSYVANDSLFGGKEGARLPASAPDGLSNTLLFTEHYMAAGSPPVYNCWGTTADGVIVNNQVRTRPARLRSTAPPQLLPPQKCAAEPASSPHTSGILTALADGSVRGVAGAAASAPTASPGAGVSNWQGAITPSGGEILGSDW